jgi:myo-inositol-1(or 4)-monophosphatase
MRDTVGMMDEENGRIESLIDDVRKAGSALLELWPGRAPNADASGLSITSKADGSLVSEADFKSNEILLRALSTYFPEDAILSEESTFDAGELQRSKRVWVIDPLDGTSAFLSGRDDFSVLVGLCENKRPTLGIMYFPARDIFVFAKRGQGTSINGRMSRCSTSATARAGHVYIRNFECERPELASPMMDSGLALLKVANGELDAAIIRMKTHREWDIAAPMAAIEEAGGTISDETGSPVPCGTGAITFRYFVASNGPVHADMLTLVRDR